jgi:hypothetical protein
MVAPTTIATVRAHAAHDIGLVSAGLPVVGPCIAPSSRERAYLGQVLASLVVIRLPHSPSVTMRSDGMAGVRVIGDNSVNAVQWVAGCWGSGPQSRADERHQGPPVAGFIPS